MPRTALWKAGKLGVPVETVNLIGNFHHGMKARISPGGTTLMRHKWRGLGQGGCMAPVLFNLYTCLAVERGLDGATNIHV